MTSKLIAALSLGLAFVPLMVQGEEHTPSVIRVHIDVLKPGAEQDFAKLAEEGARNCAQSHCSTGYLMIESVTEPKEVWVLNGFDSLEAAQAAGVATGALGDASRKQAFLGKPPEDLLASWVAALSGRPDWEMPGGRFLVISHTRGQPGAVGTVYAAEDGSLFEIRSAASLDEAKFKLTRGDPTARIFEIHPGWGVPAKDWIAADPGFWH